MKILVANDDGINAQGIKELVGALSQIAEVYVSAPHTQRSAAGHGISVKEKLYVEEVPFENATKAFSVTGTPADCVKIGLSLLKEQGIEPDMVFSGINHGANLGTDTFYSGTVSAALEGNICGLPAVAVSVCSHKAEHFDYARELALRVAKGAFGNLGSRSTISINVPNIPADRVKGVAFATLGPREYDQWFEPLGEEDGKRVYAYTGEPVTPTGLSEDTDVVRIEKGYATITALKCDLTDCILTEELKKWGF